MKKLILPGLVTIALLLTGCANDAVTAAPPAFITATLLSTETAAPVSTQIPPSSTVEVIAAQPIEGVTTTQLNIRLEPSTAGESVGAAAAFSTVQIIGRESNGKWYQILNPSSAQGKGWIIASYVQVDNPGEIPIIDLGTTGLIVQGVNIRSGPGRDFESLGTLVSNDVVLLTAKDTSGDWLQINFKGSSGWISSEFTQVQNIEGLPVAGESQAVANPEPSIPSSTIQAGALQDNDSLEAPIVSVILSPTGTGGLQSNGILSPSNGDVTDWIQFSAPDSILSVEVKCSGDSLQVDLYKDGKIWNEGFLACNETGTLNPASGQTYTIKLSAIAAAPSLTPYSVYVDIVR